MAEPGRNMPALWTVIPWSSLNYSFRQQCCCMPWTACWNHAHYVNLGKQALEHCLNRLFKHSNSSCPYTFRQSYRWQSYRCIKITSLNWYTAVSIRTSPNSSSPKLFSALKATVATYPAIYMLEKAYSFFLLCTKASTITFLSFLFFLRLHNICMASKRLLRTKQKIHQTKAQNLKDALGHSKMKLNGSFVPAHEHQIKNCK